MGKKKVNYISIARQRKYKSSTQTEKKKKDKLKTSIIYRQIIPNI